MNTDEPIERPEDAPEEVSEGDTEWELEPDDSIGDADDPHRNDAGQFAPLSGGEL